MTFVSLSLTDVKEEQGICNVIGLFCHSGEFHYQFFALHFIILTVDFTMAYHLDKKNKFPLT
jgi:hypothetical protein